MACISSSVYCGVPGKSPLLSTPPEAQILMTSAPYLTTSRTLARAAQGPSATPSDLYRNSEGSKLLSQWPPVMPSAGPETLMRGPSTSPASIPSRRATSVKPCAPTLRTDVKPARRVSRAFFTPVTASRGTEMPRREEPWLAGSPVRCVCTSTSPGRHVAFETSIAVTPFGSFVEDEELTEVIVPEASKTTIWSLSILPERTSRSFPQRTAPGAQKARGDKIKKKKRTSKILRMSLLEIVNKTK